MPNARALSSLSHHSIGFKDYQPIVHKCVVLEVSSIQNGGIVPSANQLVGIRFRPYHEFKVSNTSLK